MNQPAPDPSAQLAAYSLNRPWRFLDLVHGATPQMVRLTAIAVVVAWVPLAILSALSGGAAFVSFLTDYATQSRFLIILPVLILAAPSVDERHRIVAHHLEGFVREHQLPNFRASWSSFERLRRSRIAAVLLAGITCAMAIGLGDYLGPGGAEIVSWWKGEGSFRWFSLAGTWGLFVSYAILVFFTLLWLWKQLLWVRFLRSVACLDLRLIAVHPDCLGGLGFLEGSLRGQLPFSFCIGVALSGAVANRVFHHGQALTGFGYVLAVLVAAVLLICVAPYVVFTPILLLMRRRGMLSYGALAHAAGEQFEKKWLHGVGQEQDLLQTSDFTATNQLYDIVGIINGISILPVSQVDLLALLIVAFIPAIPVVIGAIPLETLVHEAVKLLF